MQCVLEHVELFPFETWQRRAGVVLEVHFMFHAVEELSVVAKKCHGQLDQEFLLDRVSHTLLDGHQLRVLYVVWRELCEEFGSSLRPHRRSPQTIVMQGAPSVTSDPVRAVAFGRAAHVHTEWRRGAPVLAEPHVRTIRGVTRLGLMSSLPLEGALLVRLVFNVLFQSVAFRPGSPRW